MNIPKAARPLRVDQNDPESLQIVLSEVDVRLKRLEELGRQTIGSTVSSTRQAPPTSSSAAMNPASSSSSTSTGGLRLLRQVQLTGSGTYTPTVGTLKVLVRMVAGGGSGGRAVGASVGGAGPAAAAGGSSGTFIETMMSFRDGNPVTGGRFVCGRGGRSFGSFSVDGSRTTIQLCGMTLVAAGGASGHISIGTSGTSLSVPRAPSSNSTAITDFPTTIEVVFTTTFGLADPGFVIGGSVWFSGNGGSSPFGGGGLGTDGEANGEAARGFGAGGAGASAQFLATLGGFGSDGTIIIDEFG